MTALSAIIVTGVLTDEGVECQAMRGDDGELYTLGIIPEEFNVGERVAVTGEPVLIGTCQQGVQIDWTKLERIETSRSQ